MLANDTLAIGRAAATARWLPAAAGCCGCGAAAAGAFDGAIGARGAAAGRVVGLEAGET